MPHPSVLSESSDTQAIRLPHKLPVRLQTFRHKSLGQCIGQSIQISSEASSPGRCLSSIWFQLESLRAGTARQRVMLTGCKVC